MLWRFPLLFLTFFWLSILCETGEEQILPGGSQEYKQAFCFIDEQERFGCIEIVRLRRFFFSQKHGQKVRGLELVYARF